MARNTRKYPARDEEDLRDTLQKLKSRLRKLQKENKILRSENETLLDAWTKTESFLAEITDGVPLEKVLEYRTLPKKALRNQSEEDNEETLDDVKDQARKQWAKWRKDNL